MGNFHISKLSNNDKKFWLFTAVSLLVIVILELTIFNYRYWTTFKYQPKDIFPYAWDSDVTEVGDNTWYFENNGSHIYFKNIDSEVKNIRLEFEDFTEFDSDQTWRNYQTSNYQLLEKVTLVITIDDYANCNGLVMPERTIVNGVDSTQYITMHLAGTTQRMSLEFQDMSGRTLHLKHATVNANVPMNFRIERVGIILFVLIAVYILRWNSEYYDKRLDLSSSKQRIIVVITVATTILFGFYLIKSNTLVARNLIWFSPEYGNRYNLLTEAILKGHFYIDKEVDPIIYTVENPYDPAALRNVGIYWSDLAYYNGKYYIYFGIVPVLFFYLPAKIIFGIDVNTFQCMNILIPFFVVGSFLLVYEIAKKYRHGKSPIGLLAYLLLSLLFVYGSFGFFGLSSPDMYYLPIFTAMVLSVWGLWFWLTALKTDSETNLQEFRLGYCDHLCGWRLAAGSACISLLAGSRPQFLILAFLAIPIFKDTVFKNRLLFSRHSYGKTLCFVLPVLLFAAFMFWYNYSRFGNIFDFGANYNQTSNDMTSRGWSVGRAFQGFYYFLIQPTVWEEAFPFIHNAIHNTQYMGTNIFETTYGGILFLQPSLFSLALIPKLRRNLKEHRIYLFLIMLICFGAIIACVDSIMAAVLARYYLDFGIPFMLAVIVIYLETEMLPSDSIIRKTTHRMLPLITCFAVLITVLLVYKVIDDGASGWYSNPLRFYQLKTLIEFWY